MVPGGSGPGSAACLNLAGHDHVLMKFPFSPPGEVQLRTLISLPQCSTQTCSWQLGVSHSEQPSSGHIAAGNPPWSTQQPSQIPLWWPWVFKVHSWPHTVTRTTSPKGPWDTLREAEAGFRLCSAAPVLGAFAQWCKLPSPHTVRCELAALCSLTMLLRLEELYWGLNYKGKQEDDQDKGPDNGMDMSVRWSIF